MSKVTIEIELEQTPNVEEVQEQIKFASNWNNKLNCESFTTIRLSNRFTINGLFKVYYKDKFIGVAKVVDKKPFVVKNMSNAMCYVDTGYSKEETRKILDTMYEGKVTDDTLMYHITLKMVDRREYIKTTK